jgi:PIN domain nuclease of toxin-antitoxin system
MTAPQPLLLDTCVILFLSTATQLNPETVDLLDNAARAGDLIVSPISALEIGMATARNRLALTHDPLTYFNLFIEKSGATLCNMNADVLVASSFLPGQFHKDPMDRILVSTARHNNFTLITSDRAILAYGKAGHVKTLAC